MSKENDSRITLSRRKALAGLGTIGAAAGLGGLGTVAQFTDTEETQINFTAGGIDGTLMAEATYNGESVFSLQSIGDEQPFVVASFDDIKPGDFGSINFEIEVQNNEAWVASCIGYQNNIDHHAFEPELQLNESGDMVDENHNASISAQDAEGDDGASFQSPGELADNLLLLPFYDPQGSFFEDGIPDPSDFSPYGTGGAGPFWTLANPGGDNEGAVATFTPLSLAQASQQEGPSGTVFWEEDGDQLLESEVPEGSTIGPGCTVLDGQPPSESGWGATKTDQRGMAPLQAGEVLNYGLDWHLPFTVGNEAQGDKVEMLLGFDFVQTRHTEGPEFQNIYAPGNFTDGGS